MSKTIFKDFECRSPYKMEATLAGKFKIKRISYNRRVHTEGNDTRKEGQSVSLHKLKITSGTDRNTYNSQSGKKTNCLLNLYQIKSNKRNEYLHPNNISITLPRKARRSQQSKNLDGYQKTNGATQGIHKKLQDFKNNSRIKTQTNQEDKNNLRLQLIYKKLGNISVQNKNENRHPDKIYKIGEAIGKGTFGVVYKAINLVTRQQVAIKKVLQDKKYKNRQLQILKMLHHPNVMKIHDHYYTQKEDEQYLHVVMDYYQDNLYNFNRQKIKRGCFISPLVVKIICFQMLKALNYLASISIAHRDIKPHNILFNSSTNKLVICDFGSAKQITPTESNLAYICSRCYRAPQLIFGATNYTSQVDMWSFGCVMVEIINGQPPFVGDSQVDQLIQIIKVLGTPSKEIVLEMNSNYDMKNYNFPILSPKKWSNIIKSKTDPLLIDLVSKVLEYSPLKRLTPFEAMCHEYFDDLRDQKKYNQVVSKTRCNDLLKFSKEELSTSQDFLYKLQPTWF